MSFGDESLLSNCVSACSCLPCVCVCAWVRPAMGVVALWKQPLPPASGHYCLSSQTSLLVCPGNTGRLPGPLSPRPAPVGPPWNGHVHRHAPAEPSQMPQDKHLLIVSVLIAFGPRRSDNRLNAARLSFFLSLSLPICRCCGYRYEALCPRVVSSITELLINSKLEPLNKRNLRYTQIWNTVYALGFF